MKNECSQQQTNISKDFYLPDDNNIAELRKIIRMESGHKFTYDETKTLAYELIRLYECLSQNAAYLRKDSDGTIE